MTATATVTHTFVSAKADGADATLVQPGDWNAAHTVVVTDPAPNHSSIVAAAAIANTETVVTSITVPANTLVAGTTLRITAGGTQTSGATGGTAVYRVRIGPTTLTGTIPTTVSPVNANSQTNVGFTFNALVTVRTAGAGGTVIGQCAASGQVAFTAPINMVGVVTAAVAVDTTVENRVELTYISGNAGTTATFQVACIEIAKA